MFELSDPYQKGEQCTLYTSWNVFWPPPRVVSNSSVHYLKCTLAPYLSSVHCSLLELYSGPLPEWLALAVYTTWNVHWPSTRVVSSVHYLKFTLVPYQSGKHCSLLEMYSGPYQSGEQGTLLEMYSGPLPELWALAVYTVQCTLLEMLLLLLIVMLYIHDAQALILYKRCNCSMCWVRRWKP